MTIIHVLSRPGARGLQGTSDSFGHSVIMNLMEDQQTPAPAEGEAKVITRRGDTWARRWSPSGVTRRRTSTFDD
jgi:hypothetical protein